MSRDCPWTCPFFATVPVDAVEANAACRACSRRQVVRVVRDHLVTLVRDDDDVLEADAAVARAVQAWLDRDHVTGNEVVPVSPHVRELVHLEADAVAEAVEEAVLEHLAGRLAQLGLVTSLLEVLAHLLKELAPVDAGLHARGGTVKRLLH